LLIQLPRNYFVSIYAGNIVTTSLDDIIDGKLLEWECITSPRWNDKYFASGHIRLSSTKDLLSGRTDLSLTVAGESWSRNQSPVEVRQASFSVHDVENGKR